MADKTWMRDFISRRAKAKKLDRRTHYDLDEEVIRSQVKHGDSAMLTLRSDLDTLGYRLGILIEEVGEVGKAICEQQPDEVLEAELIQTGAMALCWAEVIRQRRADRIRREQDDGDGLITEH